MLGVKIDASVGIQSNLHLVPVAGASIEFLSFIDLREEHMSGGEFLRIVECSLQGGIGPVTERLELRGCCRVDTNHESESSSIDMDILVSKGSYGQIGPNGWPKPQKEGHNRHNSQQRRQRKLKSPFASAEHQGVLLSEMSVPDPKPPIVSFKSPAIARFPCTPPISRR